MEDRYLKQYIEKDIKFVFRDEWINGEDGSIELVKLEKGQLSIVYQGYKVFLYLDAPGRIISEDIKCGAQKVLEYLTVWLEYLETKGVLDRGEADLASIDVTVDGIELRFVGVKVNAEYGAYFEKTGDQKWKFWGIS